MNDIEKERQKRIREGIKQGDIEDVMALVDSKQLKNITVFGSWLHIAAKHGQLEIVKRLVTMGAEINVQGGIMGGGAINLAALEGHLEIVQYLIDHNAELDFPDPAWNPLFSAIQRGHIEIVKLLISRGIDTKIKYIGVSGKEKDARSFAIDQNQPEIAALLASTGSPI